MTPGPLVNPRCPGCDGCPCDNPGADAVGCFFCIVLFAPWLAIVAWGFYHVFGVVVPQLVNQ